MMISKQLQPGARSAPGDRRGAPPAGTLRSIAPDLAQFHNAFYTAQEPAQPGVARPAHLYLVKPPSQPPKPAKTARISSQAGVVAPPESLTGETLAGVQKGVKSNAGAGCSPILTRARSLETIAPPVSGFFGALVGHSVAYLAKQLGLSRQRASKLLNTGRIMGAERQADGSWLVPCLPMIAPGMRGPRSRAWRFMAPVSHAKGGR